jgi:hypothetical protein
MIAFLTSLSDFGVCLTLAIVLLLVLGIFAGESMLIVYSTFCYLLAGYVTGESGMFNPNGGPKLKPLTNVLAVVFALLTIPMLAGILYGLYWLGTSGFSRLAAAAPAVPLGAPPHIEQLLLINHWLWVVAVLLLVLLGLNIWGSLRSILRMRASHILTGYGVPLLQHALSFLILPATGRYLLHYSDPGAYPGLAATLAAIAYANLWVYTQAYHLFGSEWRRNARYQRSILETRFFRVLSVPHGLLTGYLLVRVFAGL